MDKIDLSFQANTQNIDWQDVSSILQTVGMAWHIPEKEKLIFENSQAVIFFFDAKRLIGFGRAISDTVAQAAIYDIAVKPEYQGKGIGKMIIKKIVEQLPSCNFILYASPGKEDFYRKLNFSKMKTGMALFVDEERKRERGFIE